MNEKFVMHRVTFTLVQARLVPSRYLCVFGVREDLDWGLGWGAHKPPINTYIVAGYKSGFKLIFLLPGNGKDYENEYLHKKNIIQDQCHFAYSMFKKLQDQKFSAPHPTPPCGVHNECSLMAA